MSRPLAIRNAHPRLKVPRADVTRMIALLDAHFAILPADLPHLALPRDRLAALKGQVSTPHSALRTLQSAVPPGELSLVFLTDPALARIHGDFMDDPTTTDVITFEGDPAAGLAGEVCVSADTAAKYVGLSLVGRPGSVEDRSPGRLGSVAGLPLADRPDCVAGPRPRGPSERHPRSQLAGTRALHDAFAAELTLYVVHGWLHLAGYDDLRPARKRRMRAAETRAMKLLAAASAIPAFRLTR